MEFIKATYHENLKTVEYEAADGTRLFKTGGTLNWRFNNPGSLMPSKNTSHQPGRIGIGLVHNPSANKFSIFSSIKAGTVAKRMLLKNKYKDCTVSQMAHKFAPKEGDNDPVAYSIYILSKAGVSPTTKVSDFSNEEFDRVVKAIEKYEGGLKAGTEKWAYVTNITISDGSMPVVGALFKVKLGTQTYEWTTDQFGRLNTIVHTDIGMPIIIKHLNSKGREDVVYSSLAEEKTINTVITRHFTYFSANTMIEKPKKPREKSKPQEIEYSVMPGDTLSKIANRYEVNAKELAANNNIIDVDKIYPGQKIVIYGQSNAAVNNYVVKAGESLTRIAKNNNTTIEQLIKDNGIVDPDKIAQGQTLKIKSVDKKNTYFVTDEAIPGKNKTDEIIKAGSHSNTVNDKRSKGFSATSQPVMKKPKPAVTAVTKLETIGGKKAGSPLAILPHVQAQAPWMAIAIREAKEWRGKGESEILDNYHHLIGAKGKLNSTPWCASFINYCLKESGCDYSTAFLQSSQFPVYDKNKFKQIDKPVYGAIMVMRTYTDEKKIFTGNGHVSLVYGMTKRGNIIGLGGNQGGEKYEGGTIKFSEYTTNDLISEFKMTFKGVKEVSVHQEFYRFYLPVIYGGGYKQHDLEVYNINSLNKEIFNFVGELEDEADEGGST